MEKLKIDVQKKFSEIRNVLDIREKFLQRQADILQQLGRVAVNPASSPPELERDVEFVVEQEEELLAMIRNFGRFHLEKMNLQDLQDCTYLKNEDYISPQLDHETMYKNINQQQVSSQNNEIVTANSDEEQAICVDYSLNKILIEQMNESIVNITLQEAKELIKRAKFKHDAPLAPMNLEELDDELESSIAEAVSSLSHNPVITTNYSNLNDEQAKSTKDTKNIPKKRFKPKITINNCNGTINLRNISNLTINCAAEDSISAKIPCQMSQQQQQQHNADRSENEVVSSSSTGQSQEQHDSPRCQFEEHIVDASKMADYTLNGNSASTTNTTTTSASASNHSSSFSSRSQSSKSQKSSNQKSAQHYVNTSQKCTSTTSVAYPYGVVDYDNHECDGINQHDVSCDFYNRLLSEIKKSLRNKSTFQYNTHYASSNQHENTTASEPVTTTQTATTKSSNLNSNSSTCQNSQLGAGRRLVLKNFENLRIVLEANSSDEDGSSDPQFHPVQIEQWLAEIISETDLEPMQNFDILEHSNIN